MLSGVLRWSMETSSDLHQCTSMHAGSQLGTEMQLLWQTESNGRVAEYRAEDNLAMMATLMPTPRSLHDLWREYQHGVGGRKAARLFSYTERGRSKHRYSRRKLVWDLVSGLIRQGHTAETSIDKIYDVYGGQTSVTSIINGLKRDKKNGTLNHNLSI